MSTTQAIRKDYGNSAMYVAATVGGAVAGSLAQSKIKFFDTMLGRIILIAIGIMWVAKAKSQTVQGVGLGIAVSGATGFIKSVSGSINGIEGLAGVDGDGMGQIVQDENGMIYMVNGVGELEPFSIPMIEGVGADEEVLSGYSLGAPDEAVLV